MPDVLSLHHLWSRLSREVIDLLFPPRCAICHSWGDWLCETCRATFVRLDPPLCIRCGDGGVPNGLCERCRTAPLDIDAIRSVYYFEGTFRDALHQFKYNGLTILAEPLGKLLAEHWLTHPLPADVVVAVPLHRTRRRRRGYNQSALLAREMVRYCGQRAVSLTVNDHTLVRSRPTAPQVELGREQRRENVHDAFECVDNDLRGRHVLLVDDVCTTGATLEACARALRIGGATGVRALTLARAH